LQPDLETLPPDAALTSGAGDAAQGRAVGEQRPMRTRTAGIVGLGTALPERRVTNEQIAGHLGLAEGWIERRTGIRERRYVAQGERVSDLAVRAGRAALLDAGMQAADIDLVLVATLAPDEITPPAAPIVAHTLGTLQAAAVDIGAACSGTIAAIALASAWIESGRARHALLIGAEVLSRFVNPDDRRTAPLFGDAAGALVLAANAAGSVGPVLLGSDGSAAETIQVTREGEVFEMEGHETFLRAVHQLHTSTRRVVEVAGLGLHDIDLFVYHQANARILAAVADRLGLGRDRVYDCIADTGNTSAASVPLALASAREQGLLKPGSKIVLGAVGAGLTWGVTVVEWGS
jgi:3-oxoacyl-[acyl-carrier-protein] synthase III